MAGDRRETSALSEEQRVHIFVATLYSRGQARQLQHTVDMLDGVLYVDRGVLSCSGACVAGRTSADPSHAFPVTSAAGFESLGSSPTKSRHFSGPYLSTEPCIWDTPKTGRSLAA